MAIPFIIVCLSIYWTMFVRFIFFCLKIQKPVLRAWIIFIPLYFIHFYYILFYVFDYTVFYWSFNDKYIHLNEILVNKKAVGYYLEDYLKQIGEFLESSLKPHRK